MSESQLFIAAVYKADLQEIYRVLRRTSIHPYQCRDNRGHTAFHIAALNANLSIINFLSDYVNPNQVIYKYKQDAKEILENWSNMQTDEGFLAIHFAAFKGYMKILKRLISLGSDTKATNYQGLSLMHVAAQGDQALSLVYLQDIGLEIDSLDEKAGTPLHWAAYMGCEVAASVLLSWYSQLQVNKQDHDGHCPLHLATIAGNSRIVKNLLLKGADRNVQDKKGKTARDVAVEKNHNNLATMLKQPGLFAECAVKPPLRPPQPNYLSVTFFIVFFGGGVLVTLICSIQYIHYLPSIVFGVQVAFTVLLFLLVLNRDPGYLQPDSKVTLLNLYEKYESHLVCPDCKIFRPPRSRHCQCCDKCVEKFDHHCPWVSNCIGGRNLGLFFTFINSIWVSLVYCIVVCVFVITAKEKDKGLLTVSLFVDQVLAGILGLLALVFFFPVSYLVYVHYNNFRKNSTTNERFSKVSQKDEDQVNTLSFVVPNQGCFQNFFSMCCNTGRPNRVSVEFRKVEEIDEDYKEILKDFEKQYGSPRNVSLMDLMK